MTNIPRLIDRLEALKSDPTEVSYNQGVDDAIAIMREHRADHVKASAEKKRLTPEQQRDFCRRVRAVLIQKESNITMLAATIGMRRTCLNNQISCSRNMTIRTAQRIAEGLDMVEVFEVKS